MADDKNMKSPEKAAKEAQKKAQKEAAAKEKTQKEAAKQEKKAAAAAQAAAEAENLPEGSASGTVKLTRKQKKALLEKQKLREKELVEAGEIPMRSRYKPRGLFWRIFGVCLAFFMGIFATVGAIVGGGALFLTKRSGDVVDFVLDFMGSELSSTDVLTQEYLDKKLVDLLHDAQTDILDPLLGDPANLTLATLAKFTPVVDKYINDLAAEYLNDLGVSLNLEELKEQKFGDFVSYAKTTILPQVELGPMLELDTDVTLDKIDENSPMYALCYGKYGTDYEIGNIEDEEGNIIQENTIKMLDGKKPKNITDFVPSLKADDSDVKPTAATDDGETEGEEKEENNEGLMSVLGDIELGTFLGLDIQRPSEAEDNNAMLYAMCYGAEGVDFEFRPIEGTDIKLLYPLDNGKEPTTVDMFMDDANGYLDTLYLGDLLGLNTAEEVANRANNSLMYALCYGAEGEDYIVENDIIVMLGENKPTTLGDLTNDSQAVVNGLYVDDVLDVTPESDAVVRVVAYGNEMRKAISATDENGNPIPQDEYGYLLDEEGNYPTEHVKKTVTDPDTGEESEVETEELQYVGGGRYRIVTDNSDPDNPVSKIEMMPDPNDPGDPDNPDAPRKLYPKKTIGDLTAEDADLLGGVTLDSVLEINEDSSGIIKAMRTWTIDDLSKQEKIEGLFLGDVLEIEPDENGDKPEDVSQIMWTLREKTIGELKEKETIDNLKLGEVLEIKEDGSTSDILVAMQAWTLSDLSEQNRIERLKIGQIVRSADTGIMQAMQDWRISDLNKKEKIDSLTLGQVIEINMEDPNTPQMLKALHDKTLGEISTSIDTLTLEDVLGKEAFADNKILNTLRYKQIKELGDAIEDLTVEDVFGDEMWSYAKDYADGVRPTQTLTADQIDTFYYHTTRENALTGGWYTGDDAGGYTKIGEAEEVIAERYVERKVYLTRTPSYYEVNYKDLSDKSKSYSGDVEEDDYGFYYINEEGKHVDLEVEYTYTLRDSAGAVPDGVRIREEDPDDSGNVQFYYIEQVNVTYRYADGAGTTYAATDVTKGYKETGTEEEVTAYHAGVWYLLLGDAEAMPKITEMGGLVSGVAGKINTLTLGEMYVHELITDEPNVDLTQIKTIIEGSGKQYPFDDSVDNLEDLTISQVITLISALSGAN